MAEGLKPSVANSLLDALFNATNYTAPTDSYVKLHIGAPGATAASNAATETTRKQVSWAAASGGSIASDAAVTWTNISGSEDATHFSLWDAAAAGNFIASGAVTANAYVAGDSFTIASGSLTASFTVAS
jgi:hypothetical protein